MMTWFKQLFSHTPKTNDPKDPPGRTFKRVLTGDYFGLQNPDDTGQKHEAAKKKKIEIIRNLELKPMFLRYAFKKNLLKEGSEPEITAAHVAFQKEVFDEKWNMVHVTEVSFIIPRSEFEQFEKMAGISLKNDFRDLSEYNEKQQNYNGKERRRTPRPSPLEKVS